MAKPVWIGHVLAAMVSVTAAFFSVFNVLFSDIFGLTRHLQAIGYVLVVYLVFGFFLSWLWPAQRRAWRWWLMTPALLIGLSFTFGDGTFGWYPLGVLGAVVVGVTLATQLAGRIPRKMIVSRPQ